MSEYTTSNPSLAVERLANGRQDFAAGYIGAFISSMLICTYGMLINLGGIDWRVLGALVAGCALVALLPATAALYIQSSRRLAQVLFGALVAPLVGVVLINLLTHLF